MNAKTTIRTMLVAVLTLCLLLTWTGTIWGNPVPGAITGTVYGTGNIALSGASVTVVGYPGLAATTGGNGQFYIPSVPAGVHTVAVSASGYAARTTEAFQLAEGGTAILSVTLSEGLALVANGQGRAVVLVAANANSKTVAAAGKLSGYAEKSTGASLPVASQIDPNEPAGTVHVYVGMAAPEHTGVASLLTGLKDDGFVIHSEGQSISIVGPTAFGTEFGVNEFLEKYVGVRWLLPGPDGEDVPVSDELRVPEETVRQDPAFFSRYFYIYPSANSSIWPMYTEWTSNNKIRQVVNPAHNLHNLFPPSKYGATRPDFYPNGQVPTGNIGWQPCFSNPDTMAEAVYTIKQYFANNPNAVSYSLTVNDSGGYCEANPSHPAYPNKLNSIGWQDMSNIYYSWVNQVAAGVLQQYPDKYFGVLAYAEVYDPPTNVTLNSHVIPFITDDRLSWAEPVAGTEGRDLTDAWSEAALTFGFYEYLYGSPYTVPRVYPHQMADNYRYARDQGADVQVAEAYANWGEGPKLWLSAKLQWNPDVDEDALLDEWYERAVGPAAAPYLKAYYDYWEQFWTDRVFETSWYKNWRAMQGRSNYMHLQNMGYLQAVTDQDMVLSRGWLEAAVANAQTAAQLKRAQMLLDQFEYYEASVFSYPRNLDIPPVASAAEGLDWLDRYVDSLQLADSRLTLVQSFNSDPWLIQGYLPTTWNYNTVWSGFNDRMLHALAAWVASEPAGGIVRTQIQQQIASAGTSAKVRNYLKLIVAEASGTAPINTNASFETGTVTSAPPFGYWKQPPVTSEVIQRTTAAAHTGSYSTEMKGITTFGAVTLITSVTAGVYGVTADYYTLPDSISGTGSVYMTASLLDANNKTLSTFRTDRRIAADTSGDWATLAWVGDIPAQINGVPVAKLSLVLYANAFNQGESLYVDDFEVIPLN
ncbi:DUF4838 domain-containing protein [Paenibacillus mesophilus]|uniref:DUF4838 domain-containing protein n=1 Tax=Paenibacillus mesophilus TaxID=2582849 RepID=UPI00110E0A90|nr:DUF4838 domain-containing protein [Paenibacillus mesophilus]TMV44689.1 DUF4838 domain-containing protein [Paenibacillus mesophilus]